MGGCCVLIAVFRVASIGIRTACGAIAFSVLALVPMLIRVAVLAFLFNLQVPFRAGLCWHCLCPGSFLVVASFPFHSNRISVQFRCTWLWSLNEFQFPRCNFHLSQACVVRSFGCNFQELFVVRCFLA